MRNLCALAYVSLCQVLGFFLYGFPVFHSEKEPFLSTSAHQAWDDEKKNARFFQGPFALEGSIEIPLH